MSDRAEESEASPLTNDEFSELDKMWDEIEAESSKEE